LKLNGSGLPFCFHLLGADPVPVDKDNRISDPVILCFANCKNHIRYDKESSYLDCQCHARTWVQAWVPVPDAGLIKEPDKPPIPDPRPGNLRFRKSHARYGRVLVRYNVPVAKCSTYRSSASGAKRLCSVDACDVTATFLFRSLIVVTLTVCGSRREADMSSCFMHHAGACGNLKEEARTSSVRGFFPYK
jgi:hypothetical protein